MSMLKFPIKFTPKHDELPSPSIPHERVSHVDKTYTGILNLLARMQERQIVLEDEIRERQQELAEVVQVMEALKLSHDKLAHCKQ
jgi:hypothetical protein